MNLMDMIEKAQIVVGEYGYEAQSRQLIEEMAELTQAINKDWRLYKKFYETQDQSLHPELDESHKKLVEEIADVYFVLHQIAYEIGAFQNGELEKAIDFKVKRQMQRLEKSRKEKLAREIKTAEELLDAGENDLTPEERERLDRVKRIPNEAKDLFLFIESSKRELVMKLEKERKDILNYLNGFTDKCESTIGGDTRE